MFKFRQKISNESEERKNKRWNHFSKKSEGGAHKTYLNSLIGKLKSKKIIIFLCLAIATFIIIPVISILLAFLAGRWLRLTGEKSLKKEFV
jgi:hypothetical protein